MTESQRALAGIGASNAILTLVRNEDLGFVGRRESVLIERYVEGMRVGTSASHDMLDLFADDGIIQRRPDTYVGKDTIRRSFPDSHLNASADMALTLDQVDVEGDHIRQRVDVHVAHVPAPMRAQDLWTISNGEILRLETNFLQL
jgi:hypothetical protein